MNFNQGLSVNFYIGIICIAVTVAGCSAPGAPILRSSTADGEGEFIAQCKNVSSRYRVDQYITEFYLSTWGSAFLEGAQQGVSEGFDQAVLSMNAARQRLWGFARSAAGSMYRNNDENVLFSAKAFCRSFPASFDKVVYAVEGILPQLGNAIYIRDRSSGYFETHFAMRRHSGAEWRDRYVVGIVPESSGRTVVRVARILEISRLRGPYNEATSVGHNEVWFLTRIGDAIR